MSSAGNARVASLPVPIKTACLPDGRRIVSQQFSENYVDTQSQQPITLLGQTLYAAPPYILNLSQMSAPLSQQSTLILSFTTANGDEGGMLLLIDIGNGIPIWAAGTASSSGGESLLYMILPFLSVTNVVSVTIFTNTQNNGGFAMSVGVGNFDVDPIVVQSTTVISL